MFATKTPERHPANIYLFKVNKRNAKKRRRSGAFIVEHISHIFHIVLVFLLLTLDM